MNFADIRKIHGLSQKEMSVFLNTPLTTLRNWEQGVCHPNGATVTLYKLVENNDKDILVALLQIACRRKHSDVKGVYVLKKLIAKIMKDKPSRSLMETVILESNPQWTAEQLGFKVTMVHD